MDYQRYLASREWALKKEQVRKRSRDKCERCKRAPYEATHHLTYERVGNERLEDLQAVCNACHEFLSAKTHVDPVEVYAKEKRIGDLVGRFVKETGIDPNKLTVIQLMHRLASLDKRSILEEFVQAYAAEV